MINLLVYNIASSSSSKTTTSFVTSFKMPSSPKSKQHPIRINKKLSMVVISCSAIIFITASFWLGVVIGECSTRGEMWSVRVLWQKNGSTEGSEEVKDIASDDILENGYVNVHANAVTELGVKRHKVMAFVGIMTGYDSSGRRQSLRNTWMPSDQQSSQRMEESTGLAFRFIIGKSKNETRSQELQMELLKYDDFMVLDFLEDHTKPPYKTYLFLKTAYAFFDCHYYVKVQDDIYLRPDRLSLLLAKDRSHTQTYLGCMTRSDTSSDPRHRFQKRIAGSSHILHAQRSIFALSADVVANLLALGHNSLRMFRWEDVTIGAWMLAMNVNYEDNKLLCATECSLRSIVVTDFPTCSGLCDAEERLLELHEQAECSKSPTYSENRVLNLLEWGYLLQNKSRTQQGKTQKRQLP